MCFFRVQNILFTRIGIDELDSLNERQRNLLRAYLTQSVDSVTNKTDQVKKLIYVSMILIFIAHATITDSQTKQSHYNGGKAPTLQQTFKEQLPKMALTQIAEFILMIVDRILEAPSVW